MKFLIIVIFIFFYSIAFSDTYMCYFPCPTSDKENCSQYYTRIDKNSFYEDKKWNVFEA